MKTLLNGAAFLCLQIAMAQTAAADDHPQAGEAPAAPAAKPKPQDADSALPQDYRDAIHRYVNHEKMKIVGGVAAGEGEFPWQVSLEVAKYADPVHFCGGSIYSAQWIVTAAHCMTGLAPDKFVVVAGVNHLKTGMARSAVAKVIVHPNYNHATNLNDIALVKLTQPLTLGAKTQAIALQTAQGQAAFVNLVTSLTVTGWGATSEGGDVVADLKKVAVPFVNRDTCNKKFAYDGSVPVGQFCAGLTAGGKDSCQGDSGGPLVYLPSGAPPRLSGVVSWGDGCAKPQKYGVYTQLADYAGWIAANAQ